MTDITFLFFIERSTSEFVITVHYFKNREDLQKYLCLFLTTIVWFTRVKNRTKNVPCKIQVWNSSTTNKLPVVDHDRHPMDVMNRILCKNGFFTLFQSAVLGTYSFLNCLKIEKSCELENLPTILVP